MKNLVIFACFLLIKMTTHSVIFTCFLIFMLKNPNDKRQILCDGNLIELFGVKEFHGFGVAKLLSPHLSKPGTVSNDLASLIGS